MSSGNGRKETQSNLSKVTSPGMTRIFKPYSREMAEIGDVFIVKNKITNRLTAKRLPLWTIARECLAANACFNCTGNKHRADNCKSRSSCQICQRYHTSICSSLGNQLMTVTAMGRPTVIYLVVVVEVLGVVSWVVRNRCWKFVCFSSVT